MKVNWKYALGEILIVIIGLTLAFSLNNWKEDRSNQALKKQYLEHLASDIHKEIEQLENNQIAIQSKLNQINEIRPFLGNKQIRRDTILGKVFSLSRMINFYPESTTYQTLVNSGDLKLLGNIALRRSIEEHFAFHQVVLQDYQRIENIHEKYLGDFFIYHIDFNEVFQGNTSFLDNPLLKNIITSIQGSYSLILTSNKKCLESNKALLAKIEGELEGGK